MVVVVMMFGSSLFVRCGAMILVVVVVVGSSSSDGDGQGHPPGWRRPGWCGRCRHWQGTRRQEG